MVLRYNKEYSQDIGLPNSITYSTIGFILQVRDLFNPPSTIINDIGIKRGMNVLDFGCGFGSFSFAAAEILQGTGKVYALDIHPKAIKKINQISKKREIKNIETIQSSGIIDLPSKSIDVALLFYVFNDLKNKNEVLQELHRVIKPKGVLSFSEFNMNLSRKISETGLFKPIMKNKKTHSFVKNIV